MLAQGKGRELLTALKPELQQNFDNIAHAKNMQDVATNTSVIQNAAMTYNIPETSISTLLPEENEVLNNIVSGALIKDGGGAVTGINMNTIGTGDIDTLSQMLIANNGGTVFGDTPQADMAKYSRFMPQHIESADGQLHNTFADKYSTEVNVLSFDPNVQKYANKAPVFTKKNGDNVIEKVHDLPTLTGHILHHDSDYHLSSLAVMSGVPRETLARQMATKAILFTDGSTDNGKTLQDSLDTIKTRNKGVALNFPVYSGTSSGINITAAPSVVRNYLPNVTDEGKAVSILGVAAEKAYNDHVKEMTQTSGIDNSAQGKGIKKGIVQNTKDYAYSKSEMHLISQNGLLKLVSPSGEAIIITRHDIEHSKTEGLGVYDETKAYAFPLRVKP